MSDVLCASNGAEPRSIFQVHPRLVWIMALACGVGVANLWYSQPLLVEMGRSFHVSSQQIGLVATLTQVGYALGMLLFVPLADLLDRRRLIVVLTLSVCGALVATAVAPSLHWLLVASFLIGLTTVVPQAIIPFAASLAQPQERGRIIGSLYTGLLLGILLARTVSGFMGQYVGWRAMFWLAAVMMVGTAILLRLFLPKDSHSSDQSYPRLMQSLWKLVKDEPELRETALIGGGMFGAFSAFWTTLAFLLAAPSYHYGSQVAGLFGLIGATGATVAPWAGRKADRHGPRLVRGLALTATVIAFLILGMGARHLWALVLGVIVLDGGVQAAHVCNQTRLFGLFPKAHGRVNTIYMMGFFGGGSVGSLLGVWCWTHWHWAGVCAVGMTMTALAFLIHLWGGREGEVVAGAVVSEQG
jgi:predicted MFS family arabinose efflux permease